MPGPLLLPSAPVQLATARVFQRGRSQAGCGEGERVGQGRTFCGRQSDDVASAPPPQHRALPTRRVRPPDPLTRGRTRRHWQVNLPQTGHVPGPSKRRLSFMLTTLRHSLRSLRRSPVYSTAAVLTLGLGLGANAVVYSFANAVFVRPLPFADESRLVTIGTTLRDSAGNRTGTANGTGEIDFVEIAARNKTFSGVGTVLAASAEVLRADRPEAVNAARVSASIWKVLGTRPLAGRVFRDDEDYASAPIVVVGERFQRRYFPGSPRDAIGKTLTINGLPRSVIGVMPAAFTPALVTSELWLPLGLNAATITNRNGTRLHAMVGRLEPGVSIARADADLARISGDLAKEFPVSHRGWIAGAAPLRQVAGGNSRTLSLTLMALVVMLLALACFNVANLAFVRMNGRLRELSTHLALGSGQRPLVVSQLCEGALIGLGGGAVGIAIVAVALHPLLAAAPQGNPLIDLVTIDWRVVVFVALLSVITGTALTFGPAVVGIRTASAGLLAGASRKSYVSIGQRRLRQWLLAGQAMTAAFLLIASLTMAVGMYRLTHLDTGIRADGVFVAKLTLPAARFKDLPSRGAFIERTVSALRSTPGIINASATNGVFNLNSWTTSITTDRHGPEHIGDVLQFRRAWPGYFETVGIRARRGRLFEATDRDSAPPVAIVSESFAKKYYPSGDIIGRRIRRTGNSALPWLTVVGVVPDVMDAGVGVDLGPVLYTVMTQSNTSAVSLVIHTSLPEPAAERAVREAMRISDSQLPIDDFASMASLMDATLGLQKLRMLVIGSLAILALVLASLGIYGVTAYVMTERTREIAIRIAIGAPPRRMVARVAGSIYVWIIAGEVVGVGAAIAAAIRWSSLLPDIGGAGPLVCGAAVTLLAIIGAIAAAVPAYRASGLSPALVLRRE